MLCCFVPYTAIICCTCQVGMDSRQGSSIVEPKSWGELLNSYRTTFGSQSYVSCTASSDPQVRYTRSVPSVCPLAETKHPLYSVGSSGPHLTNTQDGSAQRSQWHGWGDVSLIKQDGLEGQPHPRGQTKPTGKKALPAPCKEGRNGLFGLLQGTEAGGTDAWLGHPQIDPTKGKRSLSPPTDPKRTADMTQLLAQTAPASPAQDAWLGNISIDPAKGKGHASDPASTRGRQDLFAIIQQSVLHEVGGEAGSSNSSSSGSGLKQCPADQDAWMGNRLIQPSKGKKPVDSPAAAVALHAATFKGPPPTEGCWCDLPPIGKRPLSPPSNAHHFVSAAQTLAMEVPLPPQAVLGSGKPQGKAHPSQPCTNSNPTKVDMYSLMTFKPLTSDETGRCQQTWNDAPHQSRKKPINGVTAAGSKSLQQLLAAQPAQPVRFVPYGGLAQECGMTLDAIVANRKHFKR